MDQAFNLSKTPLLVSSMPVSAQPVKARSEVPRPPGECDNRQRALANAASL
jgi:hypothetical protein